MQNKKINLLKLTLLLLLLSCQDTMYLPPGAKESPEDHAQFNIPAAQAYFESHAHDLAFLRFNDSLTPTRTPVQSSSELIPVWKQAMRSTNEEVSLIEVPIRSNTLVFASIQQFMEGKLKMTKTVRNTSRLVVARRKNGQTDLFVITLVPSLRHDRKLFENLKNFRYLGGGGFTGKVFCSTLEGRFIEACQYVNGKRVGLLKVTTRKNLEKKGVDLESEDYESILLSRAVMTRSGTYLFDEGGGGTGGMCEFHPQYPASTCPYCLDEVIVRYCQTCGARLEEGETCYCKCAWCGQYPCRCCSYCHNYPCTCGSTCPVCRPNPCSRCTNCGSHYCYGSCLDGGGTDPEYHCPYGKCSGNPCTCCPQCQGPCKCSGCHHYPCICCQGEQCPDCGGYLDVVPTRSGVSCPPCICPKCPICGKRRCTEIHDDCSGNATANKQLANANHDILKKVESHQYNDRYYPSFNDYLTTITANPNIEYSASMKYYEDEGVYRLDGIESGTENNVTIGGSNPGVVASIHSHPGTNPSPPSGRDILTSAECAKNNPQFKYLYTYAGNTQYVLYIEDRTKAAAFYDKYKDDVDKESNMFVNDKKLYRDFRTAQEKLGKLSESNQIVHSLAYVLEKNDSGIRLLQKDSVASSFSTVGVQHEESGLIVPVRCQ